MLISDPMIPRYPLSVQQFQEEGSQFLFLATTCCVWPVALTRSSQQRRHDLHQHTQQNNTKRQSIKPEPREDEEDRFAISFATTLHHSHTSHTHR